MIDPACDRCGEGLLEPGALYFGSPNKDGLVQKRHVCVRCERLFNELFVKKVYLHEP
jgi:ribosomal protein S27AE